MSGSQQHSKPPEGWEPLRFEEEWKKELLYRISMPTDDDIDAETMFEELRRELALD